MNGQMMYTPVYHMHYFPYWTIARLNAWGTVQ
jgi:hypothetical protein